MPKGQSFADAPLLERQIGSAVPSTELLGAEKPAPDSEKGGPLISDRPFLPDQLILEQLDHFDARTKR